MRQTSLISFCPVFAILMSLAAVCLLPISGRGEPIITIRLDYKIVLNPANGLRPPGVADADIQQAVLDMNALVGSYFRGYRMEVANITEVGGVGVGGPSQFYDTDFFDSDSGVQWLGDFETAALSDVAAYAWNNTAINVYITNGICGGISSFPTGGTSNMIVVIGGCSDANGQLQLHEFGHFFDLCHTQGCYCGGCGTGPGQCTEPGDDSRGDWTLWDTLKDLPCWGANEIAIENFGTSYASLSPGDQQQVNNALTNVMSYHATQVFTSERQLDHWATAQGYYPSRLSVCDGRKVVFVGGQLDPSCFQGSGVAICPFQHVADAVTVADNAGGDIISLRPGAYNEALTINKPVTLRATRAGAVRIGTAVIVVPKAKPETPQELVQRLKKANPSRFDTTGSRCGTELW